QHGDAHGPAVERRVEGGARAQLGAAGAEEDVPGLDPGAGGRAAVLDGADEEAGDRRQADRRAAADRDVSGLEGGAEAVAGGAVGALELDEQLAQQAGELLPL